MCAGINKYKQFKNMGKYMSLVMERQKQCHHDCQMEEMLAFQNGTLF